MIRGDVAANGRWEARGGCAGTADDAVWSYTYTEICCTLCGIQVYGWGGRRGKEGDEGTGGEREEGYGRKNRWRTRDQTGELGSGTGVARHARTAKGAAGTRVVNPLGEGESEFAALNMVDSRIGCAVAGRCGPHHRPAGRTIPVAVYEPSRGVFIPSRGGGSRSGAPSSSPPS